MNGFTSAKRPLSKIGSNSLSSKKKMGKCTYLSDRKVVIRLLPPNMTVDDCNQMLSTNGFHVGIEYSLLYYVQGSLL